MLDKLLSRFNKMQYVLGGRFDGGSTVNCKEGCASY